MSEISPSQDPTAVEHSPAIWIAAASQGNLFAVPVLYRVMFANSVFLLIGAFLGTALVVQTHDPNRAPLMIGFIITGLGLSIVVNFVQLKIAFFPLTRLRETMRRVEAGDMTLRAPISGYDRDADELAATFNRMVSSLDELTKSRASQILRAQEEERKRIARELHDETSQALTSLLISLAVLENDYPQLEAHQHLTQARDIVHSTLRAIRNLSIDLRPSALDDLGLLPALNWYVKEYQQKVGVDVEFSAIGFKDRYTTEVETALYRIVQESLTNIAKHANATYIEIIMREEQQQANITITDNGQGFDPESILKDQTGNRGLGLKGMIERAMLLNGIVEIVAAPWRGTKIRVSLPLRKMEKEIDDTLDE
jgi:two-component system, NarL family, sensor histidine kinase UhpB